MAAVDGNTGDNRLSATRPYREVDEADARHVHGLKQHAQPKPLNTMATLHDIADAGTDDERLGWVCVAREPSRS